MVVIIKKKEKKPPEKYHFEKQVSDLTLEELRLHRLVVSNVKEQEQKEYPLFPVAWGWNTNGRAGNITMQQIHEPRQIQKSIQHRFIGCASGMHHSLLLSDDGIVFAIGDGLKGQLGFGNPITNKPMKGGVLQVYPRQVNPSGAYEHKRDYRIAQIACGGSFSIARELTVDEGVTLCPGFLGLEKKLQYLNKLYGDCLPVQQTWAVFRQERFKIWLVCQGNIVVWGTGNFGELGLGKYVQYSSFPTIIPKFRYTSISQISAGARHVLAITSDGELYSWGHGGGGRLGHNDYLSRDVPILVEFLLPYYVTQCSAGDAHSAVITVTRKANNPAQRRKRVATFGRGAFGRCGVGNTKNQLIPAAVSEWFDSIKPCDILQASCR